MGRGPSLKGVTPLLFGVSGSPDLHGAQQRHEYETPDEVAEDRDGEKRQPLEVAEGGPDVKGTEELDRSHDAVVHEAPMRWNPVMTAAASLPKTDSVLRSIHVIKVMTAPATTALASEVVPKP